MKLKLLMLHVFTPCTLEGQLSITPVLIDTIFAIIGPQKVTKQRKSHQKPPPPPIQIPEIYFLFVFHEALSAVFLFFLQFLLTSEFPSVFHADLFVSCLSFFLWYKTFRNLSDIPRICQGLLLFLVHSYFSLL